MFEMVAARAALLGEQRAVVRRARLAERLAEAAPAGVRVSSEGERVVVSGRGIVRRFALDPLLRWLTGEARNGK